MNLKKSWILIAAVALLLTFAVSGTIAWIAASTDPVVNEFTPGKIETTIDEDFENNVKSSIKIENASGSTVPVFVRVAVSGYYVQDVTEDDVTTQVIVAPWNGLTEDMISSSWFKGEDGFYYYSKSVAAGESTENLLAQSISHTYKEGEPYLVVNVVQQSIQYTPETTVETEWKVVDATINSDGTGTLAAKSN